MDTRLILSPCREQHSLDTSPIYPPTPHMKKGTPVCFDIFEPESVAETLAFFEAGKQALCVVEEGVQVLQEVISLHNTGLLSEHQHLASV